MTAFHFELQQDDDTDAIDALLDEAFGLSRRTKTSYRFREGGHRVEELSMVLRDNDIGIAATISYWPIVVGVNKSSALLLGPLATHPARQKRGIGIALMQHTLEQATRLGHGLVILVGDENYYDRVGFVRAEKGRFLFPGPLNEDRLLIRELKTGALSDLRGLVLPAHRK